MIRQTKRPKLKTKPKTRISRKAPRRTLELACGDVVVAGVDEAGRGALAGPLVVGAVVLGAGFSVRGIRDSKLLTPAVRERLAVRIRQRAVAHSVGAASAAEVSSLGLTAALRLAAQRAVEGLEPRPATVLLDGNYNFLPAWCSCQTMIDGDQYELCISAASVLAKVHRDQLLRELHERWPHYGFAEHKGYATPEHLQALSDHGICAEHRTNYLPVAEALQATIPLLQS